LDRPSHADYRRTIELVADLYSARNAGECRKRFARGTVHLVGCDVASINAVDADSSEMVSVDQPLGTCTPELRSTCLRLLSHHPAIADGLRHGDGTARRLSDFVSERQWRDTPLYTEFYAKLRLCHELSAVVAEGGDVLMVAVDRSRGDFADRERTLLDLVTPHLARALRVVAVREARGPAFARAPLTAREVEILEHVAAGATNAEIASALGISPRTVQAHLANVFEKLGARSRAGAVARVLREELEGPATSPSAARASG
jgi:DNA-binding CsgD family transcriptional regulator